MRIAEVIHTPGVYRSTRDYQHERIVVIRPGVYCRFDSRQRIRTKSNSILEREPFERTTEAPAQFVKLSWRHGDGKDPFEGLHPSPHRLLLLTEKPK